MVHIIAANETILFVICRGAKELLSAVDSLPKLLERKKNLEVCVISRLTQTIDELVEGI